jgi:hypothetical protein
MLLSKIGVSVNDLPAVPKTQANTTAVSSSATSAAAAALTFPFLQDLKPTTFEQAYAKLCSEIATEMKKEYVACFFSENELLAFGKSLAENILSLDSPENLRDGIVENKVFDLLESKFGKGVQLNEELVKAFKQINKKSNAKQIKQAFKDGGWQLAVFPNFKSESSCNNIELFFGNENLCNNSTSGSVLTSARISELLNQINCLRSLHEKNFAQQTQT